MYIKKLKPVTPSSRFVTRVKTDAKTENSPFRKLTEKLNKKGGRNNTGRITVRHQGGGHKNKYRIIDFKRDKENIPAKVVSIEYDPNRTANIALLLYADGERRYILAPKGLELNQVIQSGPESPIKPGNALPMQNIPVGALIHAVEIKKGKGAQYARSAGTSVQLISKEGSFALIRLRSGEIRKVPVDCYATIGEVGNESHNLISLGKAGASRWRGKRPTVRGVAMNPIDHPHGGGEGRTSGGRHPCTPWGVPTKGYKTRKPKQSDKLIVRSRRKS